MTAARPVARIVAGPPRADAIALRSLPHDPFSLAGSLVYGVVRDELDSEAVVLALARGADVLITVELPARQRAVLLDEIGRIADVREGVIPAMTAEERAVVAGLAEGRTLTEVARSLGISRRTATRRLAAAKRAFGATTTVELLLAVGHSTP